VYELKCEIRHDGQVQSGCCRTEYVARLTRLTRLRAAVAVVVTLVSAAATGDAIAARYAARPVPPSAPAVLGTAARPVRIMPLGDSLTSGNGDWTRDGYRGDLYAALTAAGVRVDLVGSQRAGTVADPDHEGHGGWTIGQVRQRARRWVQAARPDIVLLDVGTNDMRRNVDPASAPRRLSRLVTLILAAAPEARVVVSTLIVPPRMPQPGWPTGLPTIARRVVRFNAAVRRLVAAGGPRLRLADMSAVRWRDTKDGIHPMPAAYAAMAARWDTQVRAILAADAGAGGSPAFWANPAQVGYRGGAKGSSPAGS
jgi:lysophospholipase L1-like esterase